MVPFERSGFDSAGASPDPADSRHAHHNQLDDAASAEHGMGTWHERIGHVDHPARHSNDGEEGQDEDCDHGCLICEDPEMISGWRSDGIKPLCLTRVQPDCLMLTLFGRAGERGC